MASDIAQALLLLNLPSLKWASVIFIGSYLLVKGAYASGIVDKDAIQNDKRHTGTLAIQTIILGLGIMAMGTLHLFVNYPRMTTLLFRMPHISYMFMIMALVAFVYFVDFLRNVVKSYESEEDAVQRFLHVVVDAINTIYGFAFAFFAVPVLYYLILELTTP